MPVWIKGPLCLSCYGTDVFKQRYWGVIAYSTEGPKYGWAWRDVCRDCDWFLLEDKDNGK